MTASRHVLLHTFFTLPLPPSINEAYTSLILRRRDGKLYSRHVASASLRSYKAGIRPLLHQQCGLSPLWGQAKRIGYAITIYLRTDSADGSNYIKAYEDGVAEAFGFNDRRIYHGSYDKEVDRMCPRIEGNWYIFQ